MRKVLVLGASALALGFGMSSAHAEDPLKLVLGGGWSGAIGYVGNPDNKNNGNPGHIFEFDDGSVSFDAKTKLDSGITVEFNAGLNLSKNVDGGGTVGSVASVVTGTGTVAVAGAGGKNAGQTANENSWVAFSGDFGKFEIGSDFNAAMQAHNDAPYEGAIGGMQYARNGGFIAGPSLKGAGGAASGAPNVTGETVLIDDYSADKVVYTTPSMAGFGATVSYTPNISASGSCCGAQARSDTAGGDLYSSALFYKGNFGDAKVSVDVGYGYVNDVAGIDGGFSVSIKGFTVGGSLANRKVEGSDQQGAIKRAAGAGTVYDLGVGYDTGPWGVTIGYFHDSAYGLGATGTGGHALTGDEVWDEIPATVKYTFGPGIALTAEVGWSDWTVPDGQGKDQISGIYSLLGTTVSF
jgi:hypothetical protein